MSVNPTSGHQLLAVIQGTWTGEGRGQFPTITSFDYRERLTFTRRDEKTLAYEQQTQSVMTVKPHGSNHIGRVVSSVSLKAVNWK